MFSTREYTTVTGFLSRSSALLSGLCRGELSNSFNLISSLRGVRMGFHDKSI